MESCKLPVSCWAAPNVSSRVAGNLVGKHAICGARGVAGEQEEQHGLCWVHGGSGRTAKFLSLLLVSTSCMTFGMESAGQATSGSVPP